MTGIKAGMGAEGFALLQHTIQSGQTTGLEAEGIEGMGLGGLPQSQQLIAETHHIGVGDVLQTQIECVRKPAAGLLAAEHTAIEHFPCFFFREPALGAHIAVAELNTAALEPHGRDHAVAIKRVVDAVPVPLHSAGAIAVEGAVEFSRNGPTRRDQFHIGEFLLNIDECAGPVAAFVAAGGGDGHR